MTAVTLAAPAVAQAETFCVHGPCATSAQTHATLESAVSAAADNGGGRDTIEIGPGDLPVPGVLAGAGNPVDIVGAGRGATTLVAANPGSGNAVVALTADGTIRDLQVTTAVNQNGFFLSGTSLATNVSVVTPAAINQNVGVRLYGSASITKSTVQAPSDSDSAGIVAFPNGNGDTVNISDVTASGAAALVVTAGTGATVDARRMRLLGSDAGAVADDISLEGGTLRISSSLIAVSGAAGRGLVSQNGTLDGRHLTIVGPDTDGDSRGVYAAQGTFDAPSSLALRDSIITGFDRPIERVGSTSPNGPVVDADVAFSSFDGARAVAGEAPGAYTPGAGNLDTAPTFRGAGDYRLAAGSPLIDAGDPAGPSGLESATDLLGAARLFDGNGDGTDRTDMGAFEFRPDPVTDTPVNPAPQPPAQPSPPAAGPAPKDTIAPVLSGVSLSRATFSVAKQSTPIAAAAGTTLRYRLTEAAKVRIVVERRSTGAKIKRGKKRVCVARTKSRRKAARCTRYMGIRTLTRNGKAGSNTLAFTGRIAGKALKPGNYRLTLTATDSAGNRTAKPRTVAFRVVR